MSRLRRLKRKEDEGNRVWLPNDELYICKIRIYRLIKCITIIITLDTNIHIALPLSLFLFAWSSCMSTSKRAI